jgi:hypothetical protein
MPSVATKVFAIEKRVDAPVMMALEEKAADVLPVLLKVVTSMVSASTWRSLRVTIVIDCTALV